MNPPPATVTAIPANPVIAAPVLAVATAPATQENFEHGRKITVKRRVLSNETAQEGDAQASVAPEAAARSETQESSPDAGQPQNSSPIVFGRR
jgi:hypothetical protein